MKNYYAILEISENADSQEIKRAYRRLAKKYHPDAVRDDAVKMQKMYEIQEAYGCLGEEEKRRRYDEGRKREASSDVGNASHGTQKTVSRSSGQRENTTFSNQSQFEQFFGFQPRKGMETYQHPKDRVQRNQEPICPEELFGRFFGRVDGKRGGEKG